MATLLQTLATRLGIVSGLDLAEGCRAFYMSSVARMLWILAELSIVACDLAEVVGSAVALHLLFGISLIAGALVTVFDVFLLLALQRRGSRKVEAVVFCLVITIALCLAVELSLARPSGERMLAGLVPRLRPSTLYVSIGILGATVMPHNLYLHSALVKRAPQGAVTTKQALRDSFIGTSIALNFAFIVNAAILVLAAAVFAGHREGISDFEVAHRLLTPLLGTRAASALFAVALLCSGLSATLAGTLAGQVVMEGFVRLKMAPAARRLTTRALAVLPAVVTLGVVGESATMPLLVASQVVLSMQLPFAIVPLLRLTASASVMRDHARGRPLRAAATGCAVLVIVADAALVARLVGDMRTTHPTAAWALGASCALVTALLVHVVTSRPPAHWAEARRRAVRSQSSTAATI